MARSLSVPAAKTPPSTSDPLSSLISLTVLISLNLCVGRALIDSSVAPLIPFISSRTPRNDMIHGRQQHIIAHKMKGIAYPIQLKEADSYLAFRASLFCTFQLSADVLRPPSSSEDRVKEKRPDCDEDIANIGEEDSQRIQVHNPKPKQIMEFADGLSSCRDELKPRGDSESDESEDEGSPLCSILITCSLLSQFSVCSMSKGDASVGLSPVGSSEQPADAEAPASAETKSMAALQRELPHLRRRHSPTGHFLLQARHHLGPIPQVLPFPLSVFPSRHQHNNTCLHLPLRLPPRLHSQEPHRPPPGITVL
nr:Os05g0179050 [Ipomoea batatas]